MALGTQAPIPISQRDSIIQPRVGRLADLPWVHAPRDVNPNGVASMVRVGAPFGGAMPRDDATLSGLIVYFDANPG